MNNMLPYDKPEIWGGMECTINRTDAGYRDQLGEVGHYDRKGDLEKVCSLGFTKFRYPILWERHYPVEEKAAEWKWTASQLHILRKNKVEVIAGLLHHGSGPPDTRLDDPDFPEKLAAYARQVAARFPWINYYTPVNEPLTTARFSGLYGFWYPHGKDGFQFARMLINQLKGIVLSMQAIREINPAATLVQTEDLAKTHSTATLAYQAEFENERRWLTYDFLMGKVDRDHFAWKYFNKLGIEESELQFFLDHTCLPAIAGFNYYVTSERYIDEDVKQYDAHTHGGNGIHIYADTEAARTGHMQGVGTLLTEAWWRYRIPVALTECQLTCTREQQLRWFFQHWNACMKLTAQRIPVAAITAWGLLGATDWDSLLSRNQGHYEEGIYAADGKTLRSTALAQLIKSLATGTPYFHPALDGPGWWERSGPLALNANPTVKTISGKTLLIIGSNNPLGATLSELCVERKLEFTSLPDHGDALAMGDFEPVLQTGNYWAVIFATATRDPTGNGAAEYNYDQSDYDRIANLCKERGIHFLNINNDLVSGGDGGSQYDGNDQEHRTGDDSHRGDAGPSIVAEQLHSSIRYSLPFYLPEDSGSERMTAVLHTALDILIDQTPDLPGERDRNPRRIFVLAEEYV